MLILKASVNRKGYHNIVNLLPDNKTEANITGRKRTVFVQ